MPPQNHTKLQPHLGSLFDGIGSLEFSEQEEPTRFLEGHDGDNIPQDADARKRSDSILARPGTDARRFDSARRVHGDRVYARKR